DDDGDGFVDCQDQDCSSLVEFCPEGEEICHNGSDDDGDGQIDCDDSDCSEAPNCTGMDCAIDFAWANAPTAGCSDEETCTFHMFSGESPVPMCYPIRTPGFYGRCVATDVCNKGEVCMGNGCTPLCNDMSPDCPTYTAATMPQNTPVCKTKGIHPAFQPFSYCILKSMCHPVQQIGCDTQMWCKMEIDTMDVSASFTYCTSINGFLDEDEGCISNEECKDELVCFPTTGTCKKPCTTPEDCDEIKDCVMQGNTIGLCL
ncbi:hypothetical protein KJ865_14620, partial [Myxococcota bacterium]|nr:hypothetical protein [Myxococcota bacterium]